MNAIEIVIAVMLLIVMAYALIKFLLLILRIFIEVAVFIYEIIKKRLSRGE